MNQFYSQDNQDKFLETYIFKGYKNGFFMDIGAHDGININNTLYFEINNSWTGINVEPIKEIYEKLKHNRSQCINLNCAVSDTDGKAEFICNVGYTEMISGLKDSFDIRHKQRLDKENSLYGGCTNIIEVETKKIETICDENNVKHINYLSIDVEGGEFNVIKSINFEKVFIDVIGFENNYKDVGEKIVKFLNTKGYEVVDDSTFDIFMIHIKSPFYKKKVITLVKNMRKKYS